MKITVDITNSELDALEDLLYSLTTKKEGKILTKKAKKVWHKLVVSYDREKAKIRRIRIHHKD